MGLENGLLKLMLSSYDAVAVAANAASTGIVHSFTVPDSEYSAVCIGSIAMLLQPI